MNLAEKTDAAHDEFLRWAEQHQWLLEHKQIEKITAMYIHRSGYLAGFTHAKAPSTQATPEGAVTSISEFPCTPDAKN
jgi:hypothetical protein